jgi:hypothetical protein
VNWYQKLGIAAGFGECQKVGDMWGVPKLFLQRDYAYVAPSNDRRHSSIEWTLDRLVIRTALRIRFVYWLNSNKGRDSTCSLPSHDRLALIDLRLQRRGRRVVRLGNAA